MTVVVGDCIAQMARMPAESVQTCITSPPYFGLRDYQAKGQHGLEEFHDCLAWARGKRPCRRCFVCRMRRVFAGVHRVLRPDGTLWLNMGDSTASSGGLGVGGNSNRTGRAHQQRNVRPSTVKGLAPKNMMGMPWRVALALQADGWILRQDVVWEKLTPMPETARDRPTRSHEFVFLLVKQRFYYYDARAIAEPTSENSHARFARAVPPKGAAARDGYGARKAYKVPAGWDTGEGGHRDLTGRYANNGVGWGYADGDEAKPRTVGHRPRVKNNPGFDTVMSTPPKERARAEAGLRASSDMGGGAGWREDEEARYSLRNKRSVWTLGPEPYRGAHFATFPESLVEPMILASTRPGDVVFDPYVGSGTTIAVARRLGREGHGIELNKDYAALAARRETEAQPPLPGLAKRVMHDLPTPDVELAELPAADRKQIQLPMEEATHE